MPPSPPSLKRYRKLKSLPQLAGAAHVVVAPGHVVNAPVLSFTEAIVTSVNFTNIPSYFFQPPLAVSSYERKLAWSAVEMAIGAGSACIDAVTVADEASIECCTTVPATPPSPDDEFENASVKPFTSSKSPCFKFASGVPLMSAFGQEPFITIGPSACTTSPQG